MHRGCAPAADDGKPKSIGGVLLDWARFMPLVTASRKGAEAAAPEAVLALARRLARGELVGGLCRWRCTGPGS